MGVARVRGLWRHPDFLKLWAGQTVSLIGSAVTLLALPLTAVLTLRASALQMGLLRAASYLPALLVGLFAGVWVDRLRRRPILIAADLGRAALLGSIPLVALLGLLRMEYLYVVAFLVGTMSILFEVAYRAFLPPLVQREHLVDANSKLELSQSIANLAGPGLGGALVVLLTAPVAIAADALSFLVSVVSVALIRAPEPMPIARGAQRNIWREIGEGMRIVMGNPLLRATVGSSGTTNFFSAVLNSLAVLYLTRVVRVGPGIIAAIFVVGSLSSLAGALVAGPVSRRLGPGRTLIGAMLLIGGGELVLPLVGSAPHLVAIPLIAAGIGLGGLGDIFYNVNVTSLRQVIVPDHLQGRANASMRSVIWGAQPIGAVVGGVLGQQIGLGPTLLLTAVGTLCASFWLIFSPIRRLREQPSPMAEQPVAAGDQEPL